MGKTPKKHAKDLKLQKQMNDNLAPPPSDIKDMFGSSGTNTADVVKELFASSDIKAKTEVSDREISLISRLYFLSEYIDNPTLSNLLQNYLTLKISRKRKSREEFINALKNLPRDDVNLTGI